MDTSLQIQAIELQIKALEKELSQKSKVYQKMLDDLDKIEFVPSKETYAISLNKNIDKVLADIRSIESNISILKVSLETLSRTRVNEITNAMIEWRSKTINPFNNPSLAGILQNPFLVSPATN